MSGHRLSEFVMAFKSRKFYVWLISLLVVLAIYLLVNQLSETPRIDIDTAAECTDTISETNVGEFDSEIGMIGGVGVGAVRKAKYTHLNKEKQVDREFGFEKLLHEEGSEWEIEKPYMNIFRRNLECYITADRGNVQVETVVGSRPSTKDATFTGNVVIHILSGDPDDIKEGFIYLDDIVFISERSLFSTAGPVKFISKNAQMLGRGLELVYNDELDRLEFLRIIHLDSLRLKTAEAALLPSPQTDVDSPVDIGSQVQTERSAEPIAADVPQKAKGMPATSQQGVKQAAGEGYRCVFSKNVIIDCPEQLIFADEVSINNIQRDKGTKGQRDEDYEPRATRASTELSRMSHEPRATNHNQQFVDIIVTCDNGILITPMGSPTSAENSAKIESEPAVIDNKGPERFGDTGSRTTLVAQRIDYCVVTGDTIASGSSELVFYVNDLMGARTGEAVVPVKITTQKKAEFLPALNQVTFEGDCLCMTEHQEDSGIQRKHTLSAPKLTVYLGGRGTGDWARIEHLTASGRVVKLATVKTAEEKLLGGIELKCLKFDYDPGQRLSIATGPGVIKVDNSKIPVQKKKKKKLGKFSLQRPCYALVRDFETLEYSLETNRIIADAGRQSMFIDYIPIVEGRYGQQVSATAGHIEALLYETAGGRTELSALAATGGITYEEEEKKTRWGKGKAIQFVGSELFYDANKSVITAWGDESRPCLFNGALVDGIKYDLKTGRVKTRIVAPGVLQMRR